MQAGRNCSMHRSKNAWFGGCWILAAACMTALAGAAHGDQKALVDRVEQLGGQITRDQGGDVIAINLDSRPTQDADLKLLAAAPNLQKLAVWGSGISDAGID